jgi:glucans biosynthesis protein
MIVGAWPAIRTHPAGEGGRLHRLLIERPEPAARITVHALLESPSLTGAYRFVIAPGASMVMATRRACPARRRGGIGTPGTSMFIPRPPWQRQRFPPGRTI